MWASRVSRSGKSRSCGFVLEEEVRRCEDEPVSARVDERAGVFGDVIRPLAEVDAAVGEVESVPNDVNVKDVDRFILGEVRIVVNAPGMGLDAGTSTAADCEYPRRSCTRTCTSSGALATFSQHTQRVQANSRDTHARVVTGWPMHASRRDG
ncbi:hypothetical protein BCR44DRAFT_1206510 [Catenaria anguillulae PL171]|uniref:Uncharacterized protein n=1 Tax=Catenaria anguillulae PL171 TaxID=765915 RepID=A0A1Y2HHE6_9FUNG|nr:hypothetical protein BCR44DRAFT_1206510 [Catenaria anguillulae PL171]